MTTYFDRTTRNVSRRRGTFSDAFDRFMDQRQRRTRRHALANCAFHGALAVDTAEIERRSFVDTLCPTRS